MAVGVESSGMKIEDQQAQCSASTNKIRWTDDMVNNVGWLAVDDPIVDVR